MRIVLLLVILLCLTCTTESRRRRSSRRSSRKKSSEEQDQSGGARPKVLKCPTCSYSNIAIDPSTVKSISLSPTPLGNQKCGQVLTGPTPEIPEEECVKGLASLFSMSVSRCIWYNGTLTMTSGDEEIPFHVSKRGCVDKTFPIQGCSSLTDFDDIKSDFEEITSSLPNSMSVHQFQGQQCIYDGDSVYSSAPYIHQGSGVYIVWEIICILLFRYM